MTGICRVNQRAADMSVRHPRLVEHYRFAHAVVVRPGTDA
jgi:hypothetical protein